MTSTVLPPTSSSMHPNTNLSLPSAKPFSYDILRIHMIEFLREHINFEKSLKMVAILNFTIDNGEDEQYVKVEFSCDNVDNKVDNTDQHHKSRGNNENRCCHSDMVREIKKEDLSDIDTDNDDYMGTINNISSNNKANIEGASSGNLVGASNSHNFLNNNTNNISGAVNSNIVNGTNLSSDINTLSNMFASNVNSLDVNSSNSILITPNQVASMNGTNLFNQSSNGAGSNFLLNNATLNNVLQLAAATNNSNTAQPQQSLGTNNGSNQMPVLNILSNSNGGYNLVLANPLQQLCNNNSSNVNSNPNTNSNTIQPQSNLSLVGSGAPVLSTATFLNTNTVSIKAPMAPAPVSATTTEVCVAPDTKTVTSALKNIKSSPKQNESSVDTSNAEVTGLIEEETSPITLNNGATSFLDGRRVYKCRYCSKEFKRKFCRERHERLHTGIKPYICEYCDERFIRLEDRKRHSKVYHNIDDSGPLLLS